MFAYILLRESWPGWWPQCNGVPHSERGRAPVILFFGLGPGKLFCGQGPVTFDGGRAPVNICAGGMHEAVAEVRGAI